MFDFDLEVKPILEVLIGKTIEQSLLEVMEEEELAGLRAQQVVSLLKWDLRVFQYRCISFGSVCLRRTVMLNWSKHRDYRNKKEGATKKRFKYSSPAN